MGWDLCSGGQHPPTTGSLAKSVCPALRSRAWVDQTRPSAQFGTSTDFCFLFSFFFWYVSVYLVLVRWQSHKLTKRSALLPATMFSNYFLKSKKKLNLRYFCRNNHWRRRGMTGAAFCQNLAKSLKFSLSYKQKNVGNEVVFSQSIIC